MTSSLCISALACVFLLDALPAQRGQSQKRVNELTLAGLRPGRDNLAAALKKYKAKYTNDQGEGGSKTWEDACTGRALMLQTNANMIVQEVTVSALGSTGGKCTNRSFDALDMKDWISGHGLQLGDPQDRVTDLYGEPNSTGPSIKGDKELEFLYYAFDWAGSDVPQVLEVYCERDTGRVVEITLAYPSL